MAEAGKMKFDIAIIGAGPGGIATVLGLKDFIKENPGSVVLIDKAIFPRDKICGDAVPYWAFRDLDLVHPGIHDRVKEVLKPGIFTRTRLQANSGRSLTINWTGHGYMIPRYELDNFLMQEVKKLEGLTILEDTPIRRVVKTEVGFSLRGPDREEVLQANFIIGSDGAPSTVAKSLRPGFQKRAQSGSAIRGYFENLKIQDPTTSLIYYQRKFAPGYFWLFPMSESKANVGFGMGNRWRRKKNINLTDAFWKFVKEEPEVSKILSEAQLVGSLKGGILPFSKGIESVIGKGYALVGDAANLNDPFSGDGIQNAVYSGILLGDCLKQAYPFDDLLSLELTSYQQKLAAKLHRSLKFKSRLVRLSSRLPFLVDLVIRFGNQKWVMDWIKKWI